MQFKRLAKISQSFLFGAPLAGDIHVQALRNKPVALTPDSRGKWTLHITILPYIRQEAGCGFRLARVAGKQRFEITSNRLPTEGMPDSDDHRVRRS